MPTPGCRQPEDDTGDMIDAAADSGLSADDAALRLRLLDWFGGLDVHCDGRSADEALAWFVRELDLAAMTDWGSESWSTAFVVQVMTRAIAAGGRVLIAEMGFGADHPVSRTLVAADDYSRQPSENAYDAYVAAATNSYPYGAGDGCLTINEAGSCGPGSGCTSGFGSLAQIAAQAGAPAVLAALSAELTPWLRDIEAP